MSAQRAISNNGSENIRTESRQLQESTCRQNWPDTYVYVIALMHFVLKSISKPDQVAHFAKNILASNLHRLLQA